MSCQPLFPHSPLVQTRRVPRRIVRFVVLAAGLLGAGLLSPGLLWAQVDPPAFSVPGGHYDQPFDLSITGSGVVRFTTNASTPTASNGSDFATDLEISETTVVRAVAVGNGEESIVVTHTYIFPAAVVSQPDVIPSGYPALWAGYTADYGMDPEVTAVDTERVEAALRALPSVSLVTDIEHLFDDETGIYTNSTQSGVLWERPVSLELLFQDGTRHFQNAGVRMQGGGSRRPDRSPKHNFRLLFKGEYGPAKLEYPLFNSTAAGAKVTEKFDTLVLRAGYNNSWLHFNFASQHWGSEDQRLQAQYLRDEVVRRLQRDMGYQSAHGRYVHLYLNGMYWGLYNIVERPSAPFAADYFGGDKEDWDALNSGEVIDGDPAAWEATKAAADAGLADTTNYAALQEWIDIESFSDYIILNQWIGNHDWWWQNWYAARRRVPGAKWRFFNWDSEHTLEDPNEERSVTYRYWPAPTGIFERLRENPEFLMTFADRIYRHLWNEGTLESAAASAVYSEIASRIDLAIVAESARWGDYRRDLHPGEKSQLLYTRDEHWVVERDRILAEFFPHRTTALMAIYREQGLYPSLDGPVIEPWGGVVAAEQAVSLAHENGGGTLYYTLDGSDPRLAGGALAPGALEYQGAFTVGAGGRTVKARVLQGGEWSALAAAGFLPIAATSVVINEINYNGSELNDPGDWVELHNPGDQAVDLSGWSFNDTSGTFILPAGTVLSAGGYLVLAESSAEFASVHPGVPHLGNLLFGFSGAGERLQLRNGEGTVVDSVTYSDDVPWPTLPDGNGPTLELLDAASDNGVAESWFASLDPFGTPAAENSVTRFDPCEEPPPQLIITEIHYNSALAFEVGDWVEIANPTASVVDLSGWRFEDEDHVFEMAAGVSLAPGELLLLVEDNAAFEAGYGVLEQVGGVFGFGLSGGGERIALSSPTGCLVDAVEYDDALPWPLAADGGGASLELLDWYLPNENPSSWRASTVMGGTPGEVNSVFQTLSSDGFETGDLRHWTSAFNER